MLVAPRELSRGFMGMGSLLKSLLQIFDGFSTRGGHPSLSSSVGRISVESKKFLQSFSSEPQYRGVLFNKKGDSTP